ncbi:MAG TPA: TIGR01210 family radical SAM protein [Thermoplasmatales archaeon]|nr:TIGR01210 family radical SAM protein [Thermoplasmatales archaeon]
MREISRFVQELKKRRVKRDVDPSRLVKCWSERDVISGKECKAFVVIFRTTGCRWSKISGCTMCGYFNDSIDSVSEKDLLSQLGEAISKYRGEEIIKIFTSGSFLDENEIPFKIQERVLKEFASMKEVKKISVETRPDFIDSEKLERLKSIVEPKMFEISLGLESANDSILKYAINKGFTFKDYTESVRLLRELDINIKTYILLKPPFLTEMEAIEDCIETCRRISSLTDIISLNPVSIHRNTVVEYLWERKEYTPPWLWSVIEVIKECKGIAPDIELKCDVTGKGSNRGAHNCKLCTARCLNSVERFSLTQDLRVFDDLECDCIDVWRDMLEMERFSLGSMVRLYERG